MFAASGFSPSPVGRPTSHPPVGVAGHFLPTQADLNHSHGGSSSDRDSAATRPDPPPGGWRAPTGEGQ
jgi:hypothetical protein